MSLRTWHSRLLDNRGNAREALSCLSLFERYRAYMSSKVQIFARSKYDPWINLACRERDPTERSAHLAPMSQAICVSRRARVPTRCGARCSDGGGHFLTPREKNLAARISGARWRGGTRTQTREILGA